MYSCSHDKNCSFNCVKREDLAKHYKNEHRRYLCFSCEKHFNSSENRRVHNVADHKNLCYQCNGCDRTYSRHSGLFYHQKTHPTCCTGYLLIPRNTDRKIRKHLGIASTISENIISSGKLNPDPTLNPTFAQLDSFGKELSESYENSNNNDASPPEYYISKQSGNLNII